MDCNNCKFLKVLVSDLGYYIGAYLNDMPYCRVSEYYPSEEYAKNDLIHGFVLRDCIEINAIMDGLLPCEVNI